MTQPQNTAQPQKKTRRQMLEEFMAAHPGDAFARYGLAIECASQDDHTAAVENFEKLLDQHPAYVSGYFQFGQLLARMSQTEKARAVFNSGIEAARRAGDQHAAEEMQAALAQL
jgi:cytochrome c-type biogenesis protein CcmH/NrfG